MSSVIAVLVMAMTAAGEFGLEVFDHIKFGFFALAFVFGFAILFSVVHSAISNITAFPDPLPEPLLRRERRATATAARRSSLSSPYPVSISAFDIEVITRYRSPPRSGFESHPLTKMYPSTIEDIIAKMAHRGLRPRYNQTGNLVEWTPMVPIAPQRVRSALLEFPASQDDNTRVQHGESDLHVSPVTAEMSARPAACRPSTPVDAATADLAIDTSLRVGPVEPPQCHSAASAADAGRAPAPTSTEGLVSQAVEPPQDTCAASAAKPGGAHMPASTDGMARPTGIVPGANVAPSRETWMLSSGAENLPPRERHPLFTFRWKPSTGVDFHLREPHPLFVAAFATPAPAAPAPPPRPAPSIFISSPSIASRPVAPVAPPAVKATPTPTPTPTPPPHSRSLPASASRASAPNSTPAPASIPPPAPAPIAAPSAPVFGFSPIDLQDWMAPLSEILALDMTKLGLTEADLMMWVIPDGVIKAAKKHNEAYEQRAQRDPVAMAARYVMIARNLKKCGVLLRLQLLQLRRAPQGTFPPRRSFALLLNTMHTAAMQFNQLKSASVELNQADFSTFKNALQFLLNHVLTMNEFEACLVHHRGDKDGKKDAAQMKKACRFIGNVLGIHEPILARLGLD
ncbi:uncharacterized protein N0V89_010902 [Didymosphaeria variabile]|uniref:Uncharacterized protein n=1 Tax=Didymosphaeria variabile TaxID=1932322 RepID=A0A9W9C6L8_9PLEO|nr:uncharacterized protein N0V89_010902 [Didymosphaeria variabile]KAJ4346969.1 hypothetical protein N0V89_010902 [Didymosphaeria variabile]